jgi:hypothetical protein
MSHVWCHGPKCHTYSTVDRVRGSKGSKVLRTRKIKQDYHKNMYGNGGGNIWNYFCSHNCHMDFVCKHAEQIIRIEPRLEPLETPINDPEKKTYQSSYGDYSYTRTTITKLDNESNVG